MPLMWLSLAFLVGVALASVLSLAAWAWLLLGAVVLATAVLGAAMSRSSHPQAARLGAGLSARSPCANLPYLVILGICLLGALRYAAAQPHFGAGQVGWYVNDYSTYVVEGVMVKPADYQDTQTVLTIAAERIRLLYTLDWSVVHGQVLITLAPGGEWHYGDRLQVTGEMEAPTGENSSSYRQYLAGQGIYAMLRNPQAELLQTGRGNPVLRAIYSVKEHAQKIVRLIYPDPEASLVEGILLGNDSGLSPEVANAFRATSTTHIIAISGFNIGIIAALFSTLFGKLLGSKRRVWAAGLSIAGILFYTILVGAGASVVRAAIMGGLSLFACQIGRRQDGLNSLAFTAALMALFNPGVLWDVGFQLSFLATLGLVLFAEPWTQAFNRAASNFLPKALVDRLTGPVSGFFLFTLAAQVMSLPVMAYHFQRISLVAFLVNPVILPAQSPLMILGGLSILLGWISPSLGRLSAALAWPFVAFTIRAVEWFAALPIPQVNLGELSLGLVLAYYTIVFGWIFFPQLVQKAFILSKPVIPLAALGLLGVFTWQVVLSAPDGRLHLEVLDVSNDTVSGDGLLIRTPGGKYVLIDGGPSPNRLSDEMGRRLKWNPLDWLVVAAPGDNQLLGTPRILERYPPRQVLWAGPDSTTGSAISLRGALLTAGIPIVIAQKDQVLDLGDGARLRVLSSDSHGSILLLEWQDFRALLPLEAQFEDLAALRNGKAVGRVSALLLAGNGKAALNPLGWIDNLQPQITLLSVAAQDTNGLPSQETLDALQGYTLLRTDLNGWVELTTDGKQVWVEAERK
jgi:competence protein ComEC